MRRGAAAAPLVVRAVADVEVVEVVGRGERVGDTGRRVVGSSGMPAAHLATTGVADHDQSRAGRRQRTR
ncbi:hypothetical protein ACIP69_38955 [Streptomyces hygroscopicus]|uniref:hypothetical protein n=1 Tax=Streptomyces hygroscopicus TaxID=1912 RepID=UPI00380B6E6E